MITQTFSAPGFAAIAFADRREKLLALLQKYREYVHYEHLNPGSHFKMGAQMRVAEKKLDAVINQVSKPDWRPNHNFLVKLKDLLIEMIPARQEKYLNTMIPMVTEISIFYKKEFLMEPFIIQATHNMYDKHFFPATTTVVFLPKKHTKQTYRAQQRAAKKRRNKK